MIYHHLFKKFMGEKIVYAGLIGAGQYGTAVVTQQKQIPNLRVCVVGDMDAEKARKALEKACIDEDKIVYCQSPEEAQKEIERGNFVYTDCCEIVTAIPRVDIICEGTGSAEAGVKYAVQAIENGKHVAMITKDCDAAVGPILKKMADNRGVVYTPVDGDQHGLLIQMVEWARAIGLTILCAGKATDGEFVYNSEKREVAIHTDKKIVEPDRASVTVAPEDQKYLEMIPKGKVQEYISKRREILRYLPRPGSYDLCEMAIAANYTGMHPQEEELLHLPLRITELPIAYCLEKDGGMIRSEDTIDLVTCLRAPEEAGLGGGTFMVVCCENSYSNHILTTKGQIPNYDGTAAVIYRPYHLCGVETPCTLLVAAGLGMNTASDCYLPRYQIVKAANRDIKKGEVFGNDHSRDTIAKIVPMRPMEPGAWVEAHLITGNRAKMDIPKGAIITCDMVEEPEGSVLWELRRKQDAMFAKG